MNKPTLKRKIMILAAGRGKRLSPLTDNIPKPLVEINGESLIGHHLKKLSGREVVINHAWLGEKIVNTLGSGESYNTHIKYSPEPAGGLETAGGIIQALPKLTDGQSPFLVINGDIYCDYDFSNLLQMTLPKGILAHLVLVATPSFKKQGDFGLQDNKVLQNKVLQNKVLQQGDYTFSGISLLHPDLFAGLSVDFLPLAPILRQAIANNKVTGEVFNGNWSDIGTLERLQEVQDYAK